MHLDTVRVTYHHRFYVKRGFKQEREMDIYIEFLIFCTYRNADVNGKL